MSSESSLPMTGDPARENVVAEIKAIVAEHAGIAASEIRENHHLENDLSLDSLDQVEIVMEVEEQFEIDVPDEVAAEVRTVGDIIEKVRERIARRGTV
jgi:acyl carrier protein